MKAVVLGAAAGGGFPQWNCACAICALAWRNDPRVIPRTQCGLALSGDGRQWILLNAPPDLRAQIIACEDLHPHTSPRSTPISSVLLTGAEIDQVAGLLSLRERQSFSLFATAETHAALAAHPMFDALDESFVFRRLVTTGQTFALPDGMIGEIFIVPGKVPLYQETTAEDLSRSDGGNVGVELYADGKRLVFIPGAGAVTDEMMRRFARADVVFFDGTLFRDDEMIRSGTGVKTGRRMGHMPIEGDGGTLDTLASLKARRIFIHINNTNPILVEGSPERRRVEDAGWEIAQDGMRITL